MRLRVEASGKDGRRGGRQMPENVFVWEQKKEAAEEVETA